VKNENDPFVIKMASKSHFPEIQKALALNENLSLVQEDVLATKSKSIDYLLTLAEKLSQKHS
jgi:hypothetical protein